MEIVPGYVHVICGPMMSGKSKTAFEIIDKLIYKEISYYLFKPKIEGLNFDNITSRFLSQKVNSISVEKAEDILKHVDIHKNKMPSCVIIDETQFFCEKIVDVIKLLSFHKFTVFIFGLDLDANGNTFRSMGNILALSDKVHKMTAVCTKCKKTASKTEMFSEKPKNFAENNIVIESKENVLGALCNSCFYSDPERIKKMDEIYKKFKDKI